ncbi:MAG: OsmC family protein [Actinobacteria bacterium]|nr:OsmC family protein [Actinomycetota bacterium]
MKTETIEATIEAWTTDPEKALGAPVVTARADESQAVIQAGPFTWRADLPPALGGTNEAPSPTALLLSALAGCAVVFVRDTLAPQLGVRVDAVEAAVRCETDGRGLLGIDGAAPDLRNVSLDVTVQSPDGDTGVKKIAEVWQQRCPIYLALVRPTDVAVQFRTG